MHKLKATILDKFLWDTCVYFSPMPSFNVGRKLVHFQPCTLFSPKQHCMGGWRGLQKNAEYVIKSDLKDKTLYWPNEFAHDCRFAFHGATEPLSGSSI